MCRQLPRGGSEHLPPATLAITLTITLENPDDLSDWFFMAFSLRVSSSLLIVLGASGLRVPLPSTRAVAYQHVERCNIAMVESALARAMRLAREAEAAGAAAGAGPSLTTSADVDATAEEVELTTAEREEAEARAAEAAIAAWKSQQSPGPPTALAADVFAGAKAPIPLDASAAEAALARMDPTTEEELASEVGSDGGTGGVPLQAGEEVFPIESQTSTNQPQINPRATSDQPQIDPRSIPDRPQIDPCPTPATPSYPGRALSTPARPVPSHPIPLCPTSGHLRRGSRGGASSKSCGRCKGGGSEANGRCAPEGDAM